MTDAERLRRTREFFGVRAATWDAKFGDDGPAYAAGIADAQLPTGAGPDGPGDQGQVVVADIGCGNGRALPQLRAAIGPGGRVIGLDVTPEMLAEARANAARADAVLIEADAVRLPLADDSVDAVLAAGLVNHLPDPAQGLAELARITRPGGVLVLFHPVGRAPLAARHHRELRPDEPLNEHNLVPLLDQAGWQIRRYDDAEHRFLAVAVRAKHPV